MGSATLRSTGMQEGHRLLTLAFKMRPRIDMKNVTVDAQWKKPKIHGKKPKDLTRVTFAGSICRFRHMTYLA